MDPNEENRLLRLAMARGLLHWEDLDAVADQLAGQAEDGPAPAAGSGAAPRLGWIEALVAAGRLDAGAVAGLAAELTLDDDDRTPELGTPTGSGFLARPGASHSGTFGSPGSSGAGGASGTFGSPAEWSRWAASLPTISGALSPTSPGATTVKVAPPAASPSAALALGPEFQFLAGWERYRIDRFLGAGGMGTVFKALDPALGRYVALKFLHRDDPAQTARFLREARAQARVGHPNICQVHEVGEVEGRPYIAMQYIDGRSLAEREVRDRLSPELKVRLVHDVALAVHAAHRTGLVHRDLKPGNVLVGTDESGDLHAHVVDFGLAQMGDEPGLTRTGLISGTPAYVSPEQAEGKSLDRRSDVYSLGVVLYELLAGRPPFVGSNPAATLVRVIQEEPAPLRRRAPAVPADLETIVLKCLEKDPDRRYGSARELAEELDRYLDGEPILARRAGWAYRAAKRLRKNRALAAVAAAAVLVLTLLGGYTLRAQWLAGEKAELAQAFGQRVQRLESDLRSEAFQPRHDTTPRMASIRRELAAIQQEMASLGDLAEGPGHYALGRGYLALHQDELAAEHLERAWRAGERGPQVAAALGRVTGILREKALAGVRPEILRAPAAAPAAREEVARTYSRPALLYLKEGLKEGPAGARQDPYLAALIARLRAAFPGRPGARPRGAGARPAFLRGCPAGGRDPLRPGRRGGRGRPRRGGARPLRPGRGGLRRPARPGAERRRALRRRLPAPRPAHRARAAQRLLDPARQRGGLRGRLRRLRPGPGGRPRPGRGARPQGRSPHPARRRPPQVGRRPAARPPGRDRAGRPRRPAQPARRPGAHPPRRRPAPARRLADGARRRPDGDPPERHPGSRGGGRPAAGLRRQPDRARHRAPVPGPLPQGARPRRAPGDRARGRDLRAGAGAQLQVPARPRSTWAPPGTCRPRSTWRRGATPRRRCRAG